MDFNDEQLRSAASIDVTDAVLNSGTDSRETHPSNMYAIVVFDRVSNNGTLRNELHSVNIEPIEVTAEVSPSETTLRLAQS